MYLEGSFCVDTLGVLITSAIVGQTFIDITTNSAVPCESLATAALVSALGIVTFSVDVAVKGTQQTLVVVRATRTVVFNRVTFLTATLVRS
jgi:hypothetical protein